MYPNNYTSSDYLLRSMHVTMNYSACVIFATPELDLNVQGEWKINVDSFSYSSV